MPKKYFFNLFIVFGTAVLAGCSTLIGAYGDKSSTAIPTCRPTN